MRESELIKDFEVFRLGRSLGNKKCHSCYNEIYEKEYKRLISEGMSEAAASGRANGVASVKSRTINTGDLFIDYGRVNTDKQGSKVTKIRQACVKHMSCLEAILKTCQDYLQS